jgi:hypothetical protein
MSTPGEQSSEVNLDVMLLRREERIGAQLSPILNLRVIWLVYYG